MFVVALDGSDDGETLWAVDGEDLGFLVSFIPATAVANSEADSKHKRCRRRCRRRRNFLGKIHWCRGF